VVFVEEPAVSSGNSFARANEGPATDPKVFQEQQKKLEEREREKRWRF
jgi:hypothetical protein